MKIAVMGAGAVGCYYGGMLARAGHDVVLIGRPQHVQAVERQGLRLEIQTFDERIRVSASTEGSAVQGAQLVLFGVKSTNTESGAAAIKPYLAPDALVMSLQNGVENADRLRALCHRKWPQPSSSSRRGLRLHHGPSPARWSSTRRRKPLRTILSASRETSPSPLTLIGSTKPSMRKGGECHR